MALSLGDLVAYIRADDSDFQGKVSKSESTFSKLGGFMASTAKTVGMAGAAAIGFAGAVGISTAAQMEQASIGFTTMLGSAEAAKSFLDDLKGFAASTPFEFPELQEAASSLISVGIKADQVIPIMTNLGNVTSGMGTGSEGIQRATVALQQMTAAGRIQAEDLNQLRDAGIPVYDLLAAALGKTKAEVADLASNGKLGQDALDAMMEALQSGAGLERFSGLMDKQSQSLSGLWSTVQDTFGQGMAAAIEPLIPLIKDGLAGASTAMATVLPRVAEGLKTAVTWTVQFLGNLKGVWDILVNGDFSGSPFGWAEDSTAVDVLFRIRDGFIAVGSAVVATVAFFQQHQAAVVALGAVVGVVLATVVAAWIAQGAVSVANSARAVVAWFATATASTTSATIQSRSTAQIVVGWLLASTTAVASGIRIAAVWTAQIVASAVSGAASFAVSVARVVAGWVIMGVQSMIQAARMAAAWFIALGPIGWVIGAIIGVVALVVANWDTVKRVTGIVWSWVVDKVKWVVDKIVAWFMNWTLPGLIISHWDTIKRVFSAGVEAVVGFVSALPGKIVGFFSGIGSSLYNIGRNMIQGLLNGAGSLLRSIGSFFLNLLPGWIRGPFEAALGIGSPSKVFADYGGYLMQGLARGITGEAGTAVDAAMTAAGRVGGALQVASTTAGIGVNGGAAGRFGAATPQVHFYVDGKEFRGMTRTVVDQHLGGVADALRYAGA